MKFKKLFEPGYIGKMRVKNRIIQAPMGTSFSRPDGSATPRLWNYYRERARGGTGLIIVEYAFVDNKGSQTCYGQLGIYDDSLIPGLSTLARVIKENGARAGIQINHGGGQRYLKREVLVAPSRMHYGRADNRIPTEATVEEIQQIVKDFGEAAWRAERAGFDMVEIHGAHGYLLTEFFSPHTNTRKDMYGGSPENRMRIFLEVFESVKRNVSRGFPIGIRINGSEYIEDGITIEDTIVLARELERAGINYLHVSGGTRRGVGSVVPMLRPLALHVPLAEAVKKVVKIPVFACGALTTPQIAEEILEKGKADFVTLARPQLADPQWANKSKGGKDEDITPCIRCNECMARGAHIYRTVSCTVNATAGFEDELKIFPVAKPKKIAVIGGGPGGMEAARVAALRGHQVTLYEQRDQLGGYIIDGSVPRFKKDLLRLINYLTTQMKKSGVKVLLGTKATVQTIEQQGFDAVILATGSRPLIPDVRGIEKECVVTAVDVLRGKPVGKNVIVGGGGLVGCEMALFLAEAGKKVRILEMLDEVALGVEGETKQALFEGFAKHGVEMNAGLMLEEVNDGYVVAVDRFGKKYKFETETLVAAFGYVSSNDLLGAFEKSNIEVYPVGDCMEPRKIYDAIHEGFSAGYRV